ncbi:MAG: hypothetical protein ABSF55_01215 [Candidatus Staskawiczbacteria bacterium]|jgi:hypothetical protein
MPETRPEENGTQQDEQEPEDIRNELFQQRQRELGGIFREALKSGDQRKKIQVYIEWTKDRLKRDFGIEELSNIEGVHLRNIIEETMPQAEKEQQLIAEEKMWRMLWFDVAEEAAVRWLYQLYGIHEKDIPKVYILEDKNTGEKFIYQSAEKGDFEKKREELEDLGHSVWYEIKIPEDFKEYVRRLREKAHHDA